MRRFGGQRSFAALDLRLDVGAQGFVLVHRHAGGEVGVAVDVAKPCLRPKACRDFARTIRASRACCARIGSRGAAATCGVPGSAASSAAAGVMARFGDALPKPRCGVPPRNGVNICDQKSLRIVAVWNADLQAAVLRQVPGAEQQVPDDRGVAEIAVRVVRVARVVPAMGLGAAHDVVQQPYCSRTLLCWKKPLTA